MGLRLWPMCLVKISRASKAEERLVLDKVKANASDFRSDINWVIMDYLVSEGYPGAAEKFAQETNLGQPTDVESIRERVRIRNAIHSGQIDDAVGLINEVDPEVSETFAFLSCWK